MDIITRDELHRAVERLPEDRLAAAAALLEALRLQDQRVGAWRHNLSPTDESEIAASLRREFAAEEWVTDEQVATWIDAVADGDPAP